MLSKDKYPNTIKFAKKLLCLFCSTYICEKIFLNINYIKSKYRNSITNKNLESILRISLNNSNGSKKQIINKNSIAF